MYPETTRRNAISSNCPMLRTFLLVMQRHTVDEQLVIRNAHGERYYVMHLGDGMIECLSGDDVFNFDTAGELLAFING